jgi:hypothetical protein
MTKLIHCFESTGCVDAWLQATEYLLDNKAAYNIVLGIQQPDRLSPSDFQVQGHVNDFLLKHDAYPLCTVATTIFPGSEFLHGGARAVYEEFPKTFPTIKEGWGTYAMRLLTKSLPIKDSTKLQSPLEQLVAKMKKQRKTSRMRSIYEASLLESEDVLTDIPIYQAATDAKHIRGRYLPCLSHLSFKLLPNDTVSLTAIYRYHYYVERALGNLFGLAQLLGFVASEVGVQTGPLICHSTYAVLDTEGGWDKHDVERLLQECNAIKKKAAA